MQHYSTTGDVARQIEHLLEECKPWVERLARKYVSRGPSLLDFDDYVSVGMMRIWESAEAVLAADVPLPYAVKVAKYAMCEEYNRLHRCSTVSLDAPLTSDSSFSLADLLSDESLVPVSRTSVKRVRAVRSALKRLGERQQDVLGFRYGLVGYGYSPESEAGPVLGISNSAFRSAAFHARQNLRSDALLCAVVGVEVGQ